MNTYTIGTRYQIRVPRLSPKRFTDARKLIKRLGDPMFDNAGKSWAGTCVDSTDEGNLYWLATTYDCDIAVVKDDNERAALLVELSGLNARRREILAVLGTDSTGRNRIAEVELTARWREDGCDHARTRAGALGEECTDCGMVTAPTVVTARCPECHSPVTDETSCFGVHTASCGLVMCQCEHIDHPHPATAHPYLGARAGRRRAQHVGLVCDECAAGHLADDLLDEDGDEQDQPR